MTETTNQTAKYSKNYSGDVGETPKPMTGTWHLEAPDGRRWAGSGPLNCVAQEISERVPLQVQLARVLAIADEPDLDERHTKLGVEYDTVKVDELVDKLYAEIEALRAKLDELENQGPMSITGAQVLDALDELDASARGDEPYNHFAAPLIRGYVESTIAAGARPVEPVQKLRPDFIAGYDAGMADAKRIQAAQPAPTAEPIDEYQRGRRAGITEFYDSLYAIDQDRALAALHKIEPQPAPAAQDDASVQPSTCMWSLDDEDSSTWSSSCGELWSFIDGGPKENRVTYCHHCGKPIDVARAADKKEPT